MNTIELEIKEEEEGEFWLKLFVDSKRVLSGEAIVLEELVESKKDTGKYLIFTCTCGVADCGGWDKVHVKHMDESINWNFKYREILYSYEFTKTYYKGEIARISFEISQNKIEVQPKYIIYPE